MAQPASRHIRYGRQMERWMNDTKLREIQQKVDRVARAMDDWIHIPGTKIRLGWDSLLGFIPGIGDMVTLASHLYLIRQAIRVGVGKRTYAKMTLNSLIDFLVGAIPVLGDVFDIFWKSNRKNAELLREEIARQTSAEGPKRDL